MIFIAQKYKEIKIVYDYLKSNKIDAEVVGCTPEALYFADKNNLPITDLEKCYCWSSLNNVGDKNYFKVNQICDQLDKIINPFISGEESFKHISFHNFYNDIKAYVDAFCIRYYQLNSLLSKSKYKEIILFDFNDDDISGSNIFEKSPYFFIPRISMTLAEHLRKQCYLLKDARTQPIAIPAKYKVPCNNVSSTKFNISLINKFHDSIFNIKKNYKNKIVINLNNRKPIFLHNTNINSVVDSVEKIKNFESIPIKRIYHLNTNCKSLDSCIKSVIDSVVSTISHDTRLHGYFKYGGCSFWQIFRYFFTLLCEQNLKNSLIASPYLTINLRAISQRNNNATVLLGGLTDINKLVINICRDFGIKSTSIHYGSGSGFLVMPMYERYDLLGANYFVCGGSHSQKILSRPMKETHINPLIPRAKPVALGLPWTDNLLLRSRSQNIVSKRPKILVIASEYFGDNRYLGYLFPPDNALHKTNALMVEKISKLLDFQFHIKPKLKDRFNGISNPIYKHIDEQKYRNITLIEKNIDVKEIILDYDGIIMTCPGTPMQFALAANIPSLILSEKLYYKMPQLVLKNTKDIFDIHLNFQSFLDNIPVFCRNTISYNPNLKNILKIQKNYINSSVKQSSSNEMITDFLISHLD